MKRIISLLLCGVVVSALAQLPIFSYKLPSASGWNGTPEGLGGLALHYIYTNIVPGSDGSATNWVDIVQGVPVNWNQLSIATRILNTTTGVLSKAASGVRDALTNDLTHVWTSGVIGGSTGGGGTNLSVWFVTRQIDNQFGTGQMPMVGGAGGGSQPILENGGAGTDLQILWSAINATIVKSANTVPVDIYMTWSNGVFWAWTNGIACVTAQSFNISANPWSGLSFFSEPAQNVWHGTLAEVGIFTNVAFVTSGTVSSTVVGVSNIHWYVTNTPVLKTNGVNCIVP